MLTGRHLFVAHALEGTAARYRLSVVRRLLPRPAALTVALGVLLAAGSWAAAGPATAQTEPDLCRLVQRTPPELSFVGRVVSAEDGLVVFSVQRQTTGTLGKNLKNGRVTIVYPDQEERFLKVGKSYRVPADNTQYGLVSSVHTAEHPCQDDNTTVNADGSTIQTGVFAHATGPFIRYVAQFSIGFAALFGLVFVLSRLARKARGD